MNKALPVLVIDCVPGTSAAALALLEPTGELRILDAYAPGPIRAALDAERAAIDAFVLKFPEYAKLSHDEIVQAMTTYRTEDEHDERGELIDQGVPVDVLCGFRPPDRAPVQEDDSDPLARY